MTSTSASPLVTVAIPTYNRAAYLAESLRSALAQSFRSIEVLVSDNASADATESVVLGCGDTRVRYLRHDANIGMMPNWNACLREARGAFFLMLSDDDLLAPTAIEALLSPLANGAGGRPAECFGMAYSRARLIDGDGRLLGLGEEAPAVEGFPSLAVNFFRTKRPTYPCAILMRTSDAREAGGYPEMDYPLAADAALWMRVTARRSHAAFIAQPLVAYRIHTNNVTRLSRVEQWVSDNDGLARLALSLMPQEIADSCRGPLLQALRRLNARVVCELSYCAYLAGAVDRRATFGSFAKHRGLFIDWQSVRRLTLTSMRMALPRGVLEAMRRLRSGEPPVGR